jgi:hypothetical protein
MENRPDQRVPALLEAAPPPRLGGDEALVFVDHSGRRARGVHLIGAVVVVLCTLWLVGVVSGMVGSGFPGARLHALQLHAALPHLHPPRVETRELLAENAAIREREADLVSAGPRAPCPPASARANPAAAPRRGSYGSSARRSARAACSTKLSLHREGTRLT